MSDMKNSPAVISPKPILYPFPRPASLFPFVFRFLALSEILERRLHHSAVLVVFLAFKTDTHIAGINLDRIH